MGLYIKGMEMPSVGVPLYIEPDGTVRVYQEHGIHVAYHAVSVPPHGRLIDADALMSKLRNTKFTTIEAAIAYLKGAPTIIPAEEGEM